MPTQRFEFGGYDLSEWVEAWSASTPRRVEESAVPRKDGVLVNDAKSGARRITLRGTVSAETPAALRSLWDQVLAGLHNTTGNETSAIAKLRVWDDRYVNAQLDAIREDYLTGLVGITFEASYIAGEPYWIADAVSSSLVTPATSSYTFSVVVGGSRPTAPLGIIITAGNALPPGMSVTNLTTGETWVYDHILDSSAALTVNHQDITVTKAGVNALDGFAGAFFALRPGPNTLQLAAETTAHTVQVVWQDRWN